MNIIEQINKLAGGGELEHQMSVGFLFLKSDDLKALAESHERLLKAAKPFVHIEDDDASTGRRTAFTELMDAIAAAEKI